MPTLPSERTPSAPHTVRRLAESFGEDPDRYHRSRPRYPQVFIDRLIASCPGLDVLDVGIGTGVSAEPLQAAGCRVLGIEVDPRMARYARSNGFEVETAQFEHWDPAGRTFDAVVAGTAWHWIDPIAGAAKSAAVLRPRGRLALFWNVQLPPPELAEAFSAVYRRVVPGTPFAAPPRDPTAAYERFIDAAVTGIDATGEFGMAERWRFDWTRRYRSDEWVEQVPTFGGHSQLTPATLRELLAGIGAAIDRAGGSFTMTYATVAVTATRNGDR